MKNNFPKIKSFCGSVLIFATLLFSITENLLAAPADLDASFGTGGKFVANTQPLSSGEAYAVLIQSNGKIILAGGASGNLGTDFTLTRLNSNGTIDTSFGTNGVATASIVNSAPEKIFAIALQADGKIVVAGNSSTPAPASVVQFAVFRFSSDGVLDTSFGTSGKTLTDFSSSVSEGVSMVIQSDDKIVVAGTQDGKFAMARLNANGTMDTSFGAGGKKVSQIVTNGNATANVLLMQADGKFVVAGSRTGPTSAIDTAPVARFNADGSFDVSFDGDGLAFPKLAFIKAGAIDAMGRLVFGGQFAEQFGSREDFGLARLNSDGSPDTSFNGTGTTKLKINNGPSNESWINSLAIQTDGKIVAAGRSYGNPNGYDFTLARFKENGTPEGSFGNNGAITTHMGAQQDWAYDLALQSDGKIVVAGSSVYRFAAARYVGGDAPRPHKFDFDGDGRDDVSLARPDQTTSGLTWFINNSQAGSKAVKWGLGTDKMAAADYDGDGKTDVAVFRDGIWYVLRSSDTTMLAIQFGAEGDVPVPADYDGDGKSDFTVVRNNPTSGDLTWYQLTSNGQISTQSFGSSGDKVVPADYNGDGRSEIAVFRAAEGRFYISKGSRFDFDVIYWGTEGDKPVVADYDGDNKADAAVFRPADGVWYVKGSSGTNQHLPWGAENDVLVPADYDGDNRADAAVFRDGVWYIRQSASSQMSVVVFGQAGDKVIPGL